MTTTQATPLDPSLHSTPYGATIAYHRLEGKTPGIVFLGGYMSDMEGTKALALESLAKARGQAFLRFDYQGHGRSSGTFEDGTIGQWARDAITAVSDLTEGPQILVGSSMGGWMMLLTALALKERVAGLVGIAAAPDFTEDLMWATFPEEKKAVLKSEGVYKEPSPYGDDPYIVTMKLIEEGRDHLLLREKIALSCPVRLIHGTADPDVPWELSNKLSQQLESDDVEVILVKEGDHRLSTERDIARLQDVVGTLADQLAG